MEKTRIHRKQMIFQIDKNNKNDDKRHSGVSIQHQAGLQFAACLQAGLDTEGMQAGIYGFGFPPSRE
jgi:hypothetical protein